MSAAAGRRGITSNGFTLTELLVAMTLAALVAIGIGTVEGSRAKIEQEILQRSGLLSGQADVALAAARIAERLTAADRFNIDNGAGLYQFRVPVGCAGAAIPPPSCFDDPANYQWDQYKLNAGGALTLYTKTEAGCATSRVLAKNVAALTLTYFDQASPPPGGDPPVQDNNILQYSLTWDNGMLGANKRTRQFTGGVAGRAIPYSKVNSGATDSGSGLAPILAIPASC